MATHESERRNAGGGIGIGLGGILVIAGIVIALAVERPDRRHRRRGRACCLWRLRERKWY